jgi:hypothetical protein
LTLKSISYILKKAEATMKNVLHRKAGSEMGKRIFMSQCFYAVKMAADRILFCLLTLFALSFLNFSYVWSEQTDPASQSFPPVVITTEKLTAIGTIVQSPPPASFPPVVITTEKLTAIGTIVQSPPPASFPPVIITTEKLTATGKVSLDSPQQQPLPETPGIRSLPPLKKK